MKTYILHLSDLHFEKNAAAYNTEEIILREAEEKVKNVPQGNKLLVVTGDFHNFDDEDYSKAESFLKNLVDKMGLVMKQDVFVIPGNHDVGNDTALKPFLEPIDPDWKSHNKSALTMLKHGDKGYLGERLRVFRPYCAFVQRLGIYDSSLGEDYPSKTHVRSWRGRLNILHLNTALIADGKSKKNHQTDADGAANPDTWKDYNNKDIPSIALGHNSYYDLKANQRKDLAGIFALWNISVYLCGDRHRTEHDTEQNNITIESGHKNEKRIPNMVAAKGIADGDDTYSEVGFGWHIWDEDTDDVSVELRKWTRDALGKTTSGGDVDGYEMRRQKRKLLDNSFETIKDLGYCNEEQESDEKGLSDLPRNIRVKPDVLIAKKASEKDAVAEALLNFWTLHKDQLLQYEEKLTPPLGRALEAKLLKQRLEKCLVLILTANTVEGAIVSRCLMKDSGSSQLDHITADTVLYQFATIQNIPIVHIWPKDKASFTRFGSSYAVQKALSSGLKPQYLFSIGVAYGIDFHCQELGDVLTSEKVILYDTYNKLTNGEISLASAEVYPVGQDIITSCPFIKRNPPPAECNLGSSQIHFGTILSRSTVLSDYIEKQKLVEATQRIGQSIVGGEMEGTGIYHACNVTGKEVQFLILKGICDWGVMKNGWDIVTTDKKEQTRIKDCIQAFACENAYKVFSVILSQLTFEAVKETVKTPPDILYHGTTVLMVPSIDKFGLLPGGHRQYVFMTSDYGIAYSYSTLNGGPPKIYRVLAGSMVADGFSFFQDENGYWLTRNVPTKYLQKMW